MKKRYQALSYDDLAGLDERPEQSTKSAAVSSAKRYAESIGGTAAVYDHKFRRIVWAMPDFPVYLVNAN